METINEKVTRLFVATDDRKWKEVESIFASKVELDYSSLNGNPATVLSPKEITGSWKTALSGFKHTHHQVGNFITTVNGKTSHVFCYGTATHFLEAQGGNVWTFVGSYNFDLI
ncbi:nuclear transport factor 2 family protein [Saccharicrinis sp. 156]|uniref:nuclear transport factor 2 family protein n=1 Tax=Saccharicrinis sp. 156 TaxID=3417574 RepID=UPI003D349C1D